jgi:hypothetical protein
MDWDEDFEDDSAGDDFYAEEIRQAVADLVDEHAVELSPNARATLIDSLAEHFAEGEHVTAEPDGRYQEGDLPTPIASSANPTATRPDSPQCLPWLRRLGAHRQPAGG